ncbi:MAG: 2-hydroxyacyl-CoA dehydratase, partial [Candidatus Binatia bacterium]
EMDSIPMQTLAGLTIMKSRGGKDGVIFAGHEGCKMAWGSVGLIRDVCRDLDRPLLVFDVDAILASPSQLAEVRNKIKEFVATITT